MVRSVSLFLLILLCGCATKMAENLHSLNTAELQLRRNQLIELLAPSNDVTIQVSSKDAGQEWGEAFQRRKRNKLFQEKSRIERELLQRYQAGDAGAYLRIFSPQDGSLSTR